MDPRISVVAPVYNEEALIREFHQRVHAAMEQFGEPWELILVNDGSRDQTPEILDAIQAEDPDHVVVVHFARNFGHQLAITAGMGVTQCTQYEERCGVSTGTGKSIRWRPRALA